MATAAAFARVLAPKFVFFFRRFLRRPPESFSREIRIIARTVELSNVYLFFRRATQHIRTISLSLSLHSLSLLRWEKFACLSRWCCKELSLFFFCYRCKDCLFFCQKKTFFLPRGSSHTSRPSPFFLWTFFEPSFFAVPKNLSPQKDERIFRGGKRSRGRRK